MLVRECGEMRETPRLTAFVQGAASVYITAERQNEIIVGKAGGRAAALQIATKCAKANESRRRNRCAARHRGIGEIERRLAAL
jgi:hypothetical protein